MPRRVAKADIRSHCLQAVDMEVDASVDQVADHSVVDRMISLQYGALCGVVSGTGLRYFETSVDFTTTGLAYLTEPADHLSTVDTIERITNTTTGRRVRLRQLAPQERARWAGRTGHARRWEFVDDRINLYPTPPSGDVYTLRYIQQPPDIMTLADTDTIDVVSPSGDDYMVWGVAVRLLGRARRDASLALGERKRAEDELREWAFLRHFNDSPRTIVDDEDDYDYPYAEGSYWYDR